MSGSERLLVILGLDPASHWLLGVFLVFWERGKRLLGARARGMRRLKWLVMLHCRWLLFRRFPGRNWNVLADNCSVSVEQVIKSGLDFLRERLLLHETLAVETFLFSQLLGSVIIALHVGNDTAEGRLLSDLACLWRVDQEVAWCDQNITSVFRISEVFLNMGVVLHVLIRGISWLSNVLRRSEWLLVSNSNLLLAVFLAHHRQRSLLEGISNSVVGGLAEEDAISFAFLAGAGHDVGRVNLDFLHVRIRIQAS